MSDPQQHATPAPTNRRPYAATSGALLAASPIPFAIVSWAHGGLTNAPLAAALVGGFAVLALLLAGLRISGHPRSGRLAGALGLAALVGLAAPRLPHAPGLTLLLAVAVLFGLGSLWQLGSPLFSPALRRRNAGSGMVRGSATAALAFWVVVALGGDPTTTTTAATTAAVGASALVAMALGATWLVRRRHSRNPRTRLLTGSLLGSLALAAVTWHDPWSLVSSGAVYTLLAAVFGPRTEPADASTSRWWTALFEHPERMLVTTFATMALVGTIVLALPQSSTSGVGIGGLDAAFTAVSAVCVTGLIVRDTPVEFTMLGQTTLLLLMQLGGLGIMTFSTAALRMLGGRMSMRQESAIARLIGTQDRSRLVSSAQDVLKVTFVTEGIGALALAALFVAHGDSFGAALWRGAFTAISAFCNAGFALQSDSLMPFQHSPLVLHTIALLIVIGGLSPAVVLTFARRGEGGRRALPVQVRICTLAALVLLVGGGAFYLLAEWDHSLAGLSIADKLHNAWFQSATLRTAGFNSVDLAVVHPATYVMMLALMFVGASPGGTAGGVKTTTVAVLALSVWHTIRGAPRTTAFGRTLPDRTVQRAAVIVSIAVASGGVALIALLLTQQIPLPEAAFEVVSALATVGLSQGATAQLDEVGKLVILACMFAGRIGPLSIMMFMSQRTAAGAATLPTENIDVG
ncbi:MAG: potassium transporter TrkH [Planctomycetes bacterium]|nr:potassium transporter TrkH [Planctomycetota bacterium]